MSKWGWLVCCLAVLAPWAGVNAQDLAADAAQAERERIARERNAITQQQAQDEGQCQQRFAVDDCLRSVRRQARERLHSLRQQEERLDEAQRQERAQRRLRAIELRQQEHAATQPPVPTRQATPRQLKSAPAPSGDPRAHAQQQQRAQAEKAQRRTALQEQAAERRRARLEKEEVARQRKAQRDARRAEEASRGRSRAAALPAASAAQ